MTEPVSTHLLRDVAYGVDGGSTAALYKVSWGAIFAGVFVGLASFLRTRFDMAMKTLRREGPS
jgi:hypothetical protein